MRHRVPWQVLVVAFVVLPLVEIYLLIQVGQVIGAWWTVLLLIAVSVLGSYLIKHEGARAWQALQAALRTHRMPARELADGALILIGGTLLLTPGFLTDALGLFFILPFTRPVARRLLTGFITRRFLSAASRPAGDASRPGGRAGGGVGGQGEARQSPGPGSVVRGEVVD